MFVLTFERGLFKFNAEGPAFEVLPSWPPPKARNIADSWARLSSDLIITFAGISTVPRLHEVLMLHFWRYHSNAP